MLSPLAGACARGCCGFCSQEAAEITVGLIQSWLSQRRSKKGFFLLGLGVMGGCTVFCRSGETALAEVLV